MAWIFLTTGTELQPVKIEGLNVWDHKWNKTGETVEVTDPLYGQVFNFNIWAISINNKMVRFAAGEFSNGMWGFYHEAS